MRKISALLFVLSGIGFSGSVSIHVVCTVLATPIERNSILCLFGLAAMLSPPAILIARVALPPTLKVEGFRSLLRSMGQKFPWVYRLYYAVVLYGLLSFAFWAFCFPFFANAPPRIPLWFERTTTSALITVFAQLVLLFGSGSLVTLDANGKENGKTD